jgi:hypothetical protein
VIKGGKADVREGKINIALYLMVHFHITVWRNIENNNLLIFIIICLSAILCTQRRILCWFNDHLEAKGNTIPSHWKGFSVFHGFFDETICLD